MSLLFLIAGQGAAGGAGLLGRLGNSNDQWGEWTAPTPELGVAEAEGSEGGMEGGMGKKGLGLVGPPCCLTPAG